MYDLVPVENVILQKDALTPGFITSLIAFLMR